MINYFETTFDKKTDNQIEINEFLEGVKAGRWEIYTKKVLEAKNDEQKQNAKKKVPAVTISGTFENNKRSIQTLKKHSGFICIDIDKLDNIDESFAILKNSEFTYSLFKSISGKGLAWIVKIEADKHREAFEALSALCFELTGCPSDPACKDVSRLRFVSFDAGLYLNEKSKVFKRYLKKELKREYSKRKNYPDLDRFEIVLNKINNDITGDYQQWLKIGFAIASKYGAAGEHYFQEISRFSDKYDAKKTSRQYEYCCRNHSGAGINIGTFYYYAKQNGFEAYDDRERTIIKQAVRAGNAHVEIKGTEELLEKVIGIELNESDKELLKLAYSDSKKFENVQKTESNQSKLDITEVESFIKTNWNLKRNALTLFYELDGKRVEPEDFNSIYIACKKAFDALTKDVFTSIVKSNFTKKYNPVTDYFNNLHWDGVDRIIPLATSLKSCTGSDDYQQRFLTRWLMGFMQNIYSSDSCPLMLIITGKKNTGKTHFFKYLLPARLNEYFGTSQHDREKDDDLLMTQKLLILDDEFSGKSKQDAKKMKRLLSASHFDLRPPYGSENIQLKRIAVLAGTCNEIEVLNDPTGNRRFIVFDVQERMDWGLFNSIDKEQLFAQLKKFWDNGITGNLAKDEIEEMELLTSAKHSEVSIEEELILKYYDLPFNQCFESYTNTEIKVYLEQSTNQRLSSRKIGLELKKIGYEQKIVRSNSSFSRKYLISKNSRYTSQSEN